MDSYDIAWQDWFDHLSDPIFIVDKNHKIIRANKAAADLLGSPKGEVIGSHCHKLVHNSSGPPESCPLGACFSGEGEAEEEFYEPHLDRYFRARIFPTPSEEGEEELRFCTHQLQDITEKKKREEELVSYPKRNPHPVIEWNENLEVKFANDAARKLLGQDYHVTGEKKEGCLRKNIPQIKKELLDKPETKRKSDDDNENPTLYKEYTCTHGDEKLVYGFHFHYLPDKEGIRAYGFDVTERYRAEKGLREASKDLKLLIKTNQLIIKSNEQTELLNNVCEAITEVQDYPLVWIGRKEDDEKKRVTPIAYSGCEEGYLDDLDVRWSEDEHGQGPTGRAIRRNEPQVKENIPEGEASDYQPWREDAEEHGFSASIALPIPGKNGEGTFGALNIYSRSVDTFSDQQVELLGQLAKDLGHGLQYIETRNELEEMTIGTLEALSRTVEAKDEYTGNHINRVKHYALEVGERLGFSKESLDQLSYASKLHGIGKVRIPDSILEKPSGLTEKEWKLMERHPAIGAEIVGKVPRLQRAAKIIAQHQEKYDGTGYPEGLEGGEITLEARIIAVVDAWDAMTTDRPYREALDKDEAIKELKDNAGSQFDSRVVDEFLKLIEN